MLLMRSLNNKQLAEWYLLLGQQISAGITLAQAVQLTDGLSAGNRLDIVSALEQGTEAVEVFERYAPWMPATDRKLIAAAMQSGRLPEVLTTLSVRRNAVHENIQKGISATIYPIFIVHLAAIVTPIFTLMEFTMSGNVILHWERYVPQVTMAIGIAWALIVIIGLLLKQNNPKVLGMFPIIRHYSQLQSISDFASILSSFIKAGATFEVAWVEAGTASRDPELLAYAERIAANVRGGVAPGAMLNPKDGILPPEFVSLYISGEQTGQLDRNLDLLAILFQEKANLKLKQASEWYPIFIFLGVAVYVGFGIVKFYSQYLDLLMSIIRPGHKAGQ